MPDAPPENALPAPVFRKTKAGKWAVMGPVVTLEAALSNGGKVKVSKKAGGFSDFTVVSIGRPFDVDGVPMCYGYDDAGEGGDGAPRSSAPAGSAPRAARSSAPPPPPPPPPSRDEYEPLPEYQGDAEDEWHDGF